MSYICQLKGISHKLRKPVILCPVDSLRFAQNQVGAGKPANICQQSPISKTRPCRDIMVNRSDMILLFSREIPSARCSLKQCEFSASGAIEHDNFTLQLATKKPSKASHQCRNKNEKPAIYHREHLIFVKTLLLALSFFLLPLSS
ncbi:MULTISPECIES: hypothetical protein [unclassified Microcoleus]|uniref:hypothetical protein n=1 Tax=unclassified Microcoleus TaxID=2642155 RepID=UPI002FD18C06